MKVNDICAIRVKKFIFRQNVFLNVSDEFFDEDILIKNIYDMLCDRIKNLEIVLDKHNNLSVNGMVDKYSIISEIITAIEYMGTNYGLCFYELLKTKKNYYDSEKFDLLNMHYSKIIATLILIIQWL